MKTIYEESVRNDLIKRIEKLDADAIAQWGKMNVFQMLRHCITWNIWMLGIDKPTYKQEFIGKIFGKIGLRRMLNGDRPLDKNVPTSKQFIIQETSGDINSLQQKFMELIDLYSNYDNPEFIHDFFGKMKREDIGILVYKHMDHHLRQFGV
jgi:hypothetical protein